VQEKLTTWGKRAEELRDLGSTRARLPETTTTREARNSYKFLDISLRGGLKSGNRFKVAMNVGYIQKGVLRVSLSKSIVKPDFPGIQKPCADNSWSVRALTE
jgi:hypothetical protein